MLGQNSFILAIWLWLKMLMATLGTGAFFGLSVAALGTKAIVLVPAIVVAVVIALIPNSALFVIIALTPINVQLAGPITVARLGILFGAVVVYAQAAKRQIALPRVFMWPEGTLMFVYILWLIIGTIVIGGGGYVEKVGPYIVYAILFYMVINYITGRDVFESIMTTLIVCGAAQALLVIAEARFGFSPFGGWHAEMADKANASEVRAVGTSSHPIILAGYFQVVIGATAIMFFSYKTVFWRVMAFLTVFLMLFGWWYTFSRSSWIGMGTMAMIGLLLASRPTRVFALTAGISGFVVLSFFDFSPGALLRFLESFASFNSAASSAGVSAGSESLSWRTENWQGAIAIFLQNPLFGAGIDQSQGQMIKNLPLGAVAHQFINAAVPHNLFLFVLTETGIVNFLIFVTLLIMAVRKLFQLFALPLYRVYTIGLTAILCGQIGTFFFNPLPREIWLTLALIFALSRVSKKEMQETSGKPRAVPNGTTAAQTRDAYVPAE